MSRKSRNVEKVERTEMGASMGNSLQKCVAKGKKQKLITQEDRIIEGRICSVRKTKFYL